MVMTGGALQIDRPLWLPQVVATQAKLDAASWPPLDSGDFVGAEWRGAPLPAPCEGASDCEAADALQNFFWRCRGGLSLELGGLDGVTHSETRAFEQAAGWRRVLVEADPAYEAKRRALSADAVGVTAAVCSAPKTLHYIGRGPRGGIAEMMRPLRLRERLKRINPTLLAWLQRRGAGAAGVTSEQLAEVDEVRWQAGKWGEGPPIPVACTRLAHILDEIGVRRFHFGIIDVEGAEVDVLRTVDWGRTAFGILVVEVGGVQPGARSAKAREHNTDATARTANVAAFIRGVGQYNELFGGRPRGRNLWYIHQNFSGFVRRRPR